MYFVSITSLYSYQLYMFSGLNWAWNWNPRESVRLLLGCVDAHGRNMRLPETKIHKMGDVWCGCKRCCSNFGLVEHDSIPMVTKAIARRHCITYGQNDAGRVYFWPSMKHPGEKQESEDALCGPSTDGPCIGWNSRCLSSS